MAELAVEVDRSGHDTLEGVRCRVVVEFHKEHAILGRSLWDIEIGGPRKGNTGPHRV